MLFTFIHYYLLLLSLHLPTLLVLSMPSLSHNKGSMCDTMKESFEMDEDNWKNGKGPGKCLICLRTFGKVTAVTARAHVARESGFGIAACTGCCEASQFSELDADDLHSAAEAEHSAYMLAKAKNVRLYYIIIHIHITNCVYWETLTDTARVCVRRKNGTGFLWPTANSLQVL